MDARLRRKNPNRSGGKTSIATGKSLVARGFDSRCASCKVITSILIDPEFQRMLTS